MAARRKNADDRGYHIYLYPAQCTVRESTAGHDIGRVYIEIGAMGSMLTLCDGRLSIGGRPRKKPKIKNVKHTKAVARLTITEEPDDRMLRELLNKLQNAAE